MSQFRVDEVLPSKSGKAWRVRTGQTWYNAFMDSGIEACVGKLIEAEIKTSEKFGAGIQKYKVVGETTQSQGQKPTQAVQNAPRGTNDGEMRWLPMASNTVAHAIAAGLIKDPTDIKVWVLATRQAIDGD